jgi:hypothetical protein
MIQRTADGKLRQRQDAPALRVPPNMGLAVKSEAWKMRTVRDVFEGIDCVRSPWRLEKTPRGVSERIVKDCRPSPRVLKSHVLWPRVGYDLHGGSQDVAMTFLCPREM